MFVFIAENTAEVHYFDRNIDKIKSFVRIGDRHISVFPKYLQIYSEYFEFASSNSLCLFASVYIFISEIIPVVEELFRFFIKFFKIPCDLSMCKDFS